MNDEDVELRLSITATLAQDVVEVKATERNDKEKPEQKQRQIDKFNRQIYNLVSMCSDRDVSREVFCSKKKIEG